MNHYERLKVSQDAPAEVVRAAYRALAAKLHPDRLNANGTSAGPDDANHTQMAALNAAYEVLIDPKLRREYDATLLGTTRPAGSPFGASFGASFGAFASPPPLTGTGDTGADDPSGPSTRVDLNWVPPGVATTITPLWPPSRRMMLIGGSALALLIVGTAGVMWQIMGKHQMEKAMSKEYAATPGEADMPVREAVVLELARRAEEARGEQRGETRAPSARDGQAEAVANGASGVHRPSVDELERMSDEELLKVLPSLDDHPIPQKTLAKVVAQQRGRHPLDGRPLNLRTDSQLVETLAPEPQPPVSKNTKRP